MTNFEVEVEDTFHKNRDGIEIFTRTWKPVGKSIATLVFVHGFIEHVSRYDHVFKMFAEKGILVQGFDQAGHGKTAQKMKAFGAHKGLLYVIKDIDDAIDRVYKIDVPLFLMGHSWGGATILNYLVLGRNRHRIHGAVASAPCLAIHPTSMPNKFLVGLLKQLTKVTPNLILKVDVKPEFTSRDSEMVKAYASDPLIQNKSTLKQQLDLLIEGGNMVNTRYTQIRTPNLLITHGNGDKITDFNVTEKFAAKVKTINVVNNISFVKYEGFYHELHNDIGRQQVITDYVNWILTTIETYQPNESTTEVASELTSANILSSKL